MSRVKICRACILAAALAALDAASGQISPPSAAPRPAVPAPKADSIPKPLFVGESAEETANREAVERALDKSVDIAFDATPLVEVEKRLSEISGLRVELDRRGPEDAGITLNMPVTLSLRQISLRSAMRILLRRVDLSFVIQHGGLLITDVSKATTIRPTALYPVADLIDGFDSSGRRVKDYESVIELISSHVAPTTWDAVGGQGEIKEYDGSVAISQTYEVHSQIESLLRTLRVARERQSMGDFTPLSVGANNENTARIAKALEAKVNLDCRGTALAKLAEMVAVESGVNVLLDERSLVDSGIELTSKVDGTVKEVPLREALDRLLSELNMAYVVRDEVLFLTVVDVAQISLVTRIYPLDDLYRGSFDDERDGFGESMVELISSTIGPTTWDGLGGPAYLNSVEAWNVLIASNTIDVQNDIADSLKTLRTMREKQDRSALMRDDIETRVYRLGPPEGARATTKEAEQQLKRSEVRFDPKELSAAIRELVEPESWKEQGVDLRVLGDRVVVRHRRTVQAKVRQFLGELESPEAIRGGGF